MSERGEVGSAPGGVVVVGAVNVDLVVVADRLPSPGVTVAGSGLQTFGGGKAANAAVAAARVGAAVHLVGAVGADANGQGALDELTGDGVDVTAVARLRDQPTGVALIVVDASGENQIALGPGANGAVTPALVEAALAALLPGTAYVLVSTEIPAAAVVAAVVQAAAHHVPCVINPAPALPCVLDTLEYGPILTPNEGELAELAALLGRPGVSTDEALDVVIARTGSAVAVTLGAAGCRLATPDGTRHTIPAPPTTVVDTTGAGDTFNGVLVAGLAEGMDLRAAARRAVGAASLSVRAAGARTGMPRASEVG
jgi:ribokinase